MPLYTECVLSMIEFIQFKAKIYEDKLRMTDQAGAMSMDSVNEEMDLFNLPTACPQSDIVFDETKGFKQIALDLYQKYVEQGSEWEINVAYKTRGFYEDLFEDEAEWMANEEYEDDANLYALWDRAIGEMNSLIKAAFVRFKSSTQFKVLHRTSISGRSSSASPRGLGTPRAFSVASTSS